MTPAVAARALILKSAKADPWDKHGFPRNPAFWEGRKPQQGKLLSSAAIYNLREQAEASSSHGLIAVISGFVFKLLI